MPDVGAGTINLGISFSEIMSIATVMTFLLSIYYASFYFPGESILAIPHAIVQSFNFLWFDDFKFINGVGTSSCGGAIESVASYQLTTEANPNDPFSIALGSINLLGSILGTGFNVFLSCGVGGLRLVIGTAIVLYWLFKIAQLLGGFASFFDFIGKIIG